MKRILVTGVNSYVGNRFAEWVEQYPDEYEVDRISVKNNEWIKMDLSIYNTILHVAGIAHRKETNDNEHLYFSINSDLTYDLAKKAKSDGVKHFIFLSSMSVYGLDEGIIDHNTPLKPKSHYGKSKLQAEINISKLVDNSFKVAILRPPMIYGKNCPGNYRRLSKLSVKTPIFPNIINKRSMIYIDNLCEFIKLITDNYSTGLYYPQNEDYVCTSKMVKLISSVHGRELWLTRLFNPLIRLFMTTTLNKIFGDLVYEKHLSEYYKSYNIFSFLDSVKNSEVK